MARQTGSPVWIEKILAALNEAGKKSDGDVEFSLEYEGDYYLDKDTDIGSHVDVEPSLPTALPIGPVGGDSGLGATLSKETDKGMKGKLRVKYTAKLKGGDAS